MLGWHRHRPQMQYESMLIYSFCRLRTEVAISAFEVEGGDAMLTERTCEGCAAIHRFSRVISHIFNGSLLNCLYYGQ
jgi:hypothetical protein